MLRVKDSDLVLTLQSGVAYGHVGNSGAAFALQRLGRDVVRIDTVRFSNHPAHGGFSGGPAPAAEIDAQIEGLAARGLLADIGCVMSGYLGTAENAAAVGRAVDAVRKVRPDVVYSLDPVMGDRPAGRFVAEDIPPAIIDGLAPKADVVTPNIFELEALTGLTIGDATDAVAAARKLAADGKTVFATGLRVGDGVQTIAVSGAGAWSVTTPFSAAPAYGAGDAFAAVLQARLLAGAAPPEALSHAASAIYAVLQATEASGGRELALIPAQASLAAPPHMFAAEEF